MSVLRPCEVHREYTVGPRKELHAPIRGGGGHTLALLLQTLLLTSIHSELDESMAPLIRSYTVCPATSKNLTNLMRPSKR
jgi:hypothetical protein